MSSSIFFLQLLGCQTEVPPVQSQPVDSKQMPLVRFGEDLNADGTITESEEFISVIDQYQKYPTEAQKVNGAPLPFLFATVSPYKIQTQQAIQVFKNIKGNLPLDVTELASYQESLAVAMYYFCLYPEKKDLKGIIYELPHIGELDSLGLSEFKDWLVTNGGLGVGQFRSKIVSLSAEESLNQNIGWCSHKSKVFFAVCQEAGLACQFTQTYSGDVIDAYEKKYNKAFNGSGLSALGLRNIRYYSRHFYVRVTFANQQNRDFDLAMNDSRANYSSLNVLPVTPSQLVLADRVDVVMFTAVKNGLEVTKNNLIRDINLSPDYFVAYEALGAYYFNSKDLVNAKKYTKLALDLKPNDVMLQFNLALICTHLSEWDQALDLIGQMKKAYPDNPLAYYVQGLWFVKKHQPELALPELIKVTQMDPNHVDAWHLLTQVAYQIQNLELTRTSAEQALRLNPQDKLVLKIINQIGG